MAQNAAVQRASSIHSSVEIREMLKFGTPAVVMKALKTYCNSLCGSCIWDLGAEKYAQIFSASNYTVKLVWGCPVWTWTYFLKQLFCHVTPQPRMTYSLATSNWQNSDPGDC